MEIPQSSTHRPAAPEVSLTEADRLSIAAAVLRDLLTQLLKAGRYEHAAAARDLAEMCDIEASYHAG